MRYWFIICLLSGVALSAQAQDTILLTDGREVQARVLLITSAAVTYVPTLEPPRPDTLRLAATEVFMVRYANGAKVVLHNPTSSTSGLLAAGRTAQDLANQGQVDAQRYFKAPGTLFVTAGATALGLFLFTPSALGLLGGAATGSAIAVSPVRDQNFVAPDTTLLRDPNYLIGYRQQAQRKKVGKAAAGVGVGLVTGTVVWFLVALANTRHF